MAQFCSVHIHAKNNGKDIFITVHHGFHHFHYLVTVLNGFSSYFIIVFIYIYSCSLFGHCLLSVFSTISILCQSFSSKFFVFSGLLYFFYIFHIMSMQKADAYYCTLFCLCL